MQKEFGTVATKVGNLVKYAAVFAFSHAGPAAWNALPEDMRAASDSVLFRKRLKTHLFSLAFNVC